MGFLLVRTLRDRDTLWRSLVPLESVPRIPEDDVTTFPAFDPARFFDVETRVLNQSVKRHLERIPKG